MIFDARRQAVEVISGMGAAPQLATREYFEQADGIRRNTVAAAAIPAAPDAIFTLLQALKLLEGFDLGSMGFQKPATIHLIVEAMKVAPVLGELVVSPKMDTNVVAGLRSLGHQIKLQNPESWRIVICIDSHTGLLHGAGDSTANRHAGAF